MLIGVPREIKSEEYRVGLTPSAVRECVRAGHQVLVEVSAGAGVGVSDVAYTEAGAQIVSNAQDVYQRSELVVKVKGPQAAECEYLRSGQFLFCFLHLAAVPDIAKKLLASGVTSIGFETVAKSGGLLPLLAPMSEIAGRLAVQVGAHHLESTQGGGGILLGQVGGVAAAKVLIIGGGVVGREAAHVALGLGGQVTIVDKSLEQLRNLKNTFSSRAQLEFASVDRIAALAIDSDLVVGAVLVPGNKSPQLLMRRDIERMRPGSVLVDVAIDQGGCFESSRPTTHRQPTYQVGGVIHYCVANIPSAVAKTSTLALSHATLPYVLQLAEGGMGALRKVPELACGVNTHQGNVCHQAVATALGEACLSLVECG
ncbi:alanine dehydrogenase [Gilvimarinus sp. SDUM040013]|uniref:Alanine dehydrogenase n=1 Tax=Gilvimarinus gilvus TaxID=3058038 RepID=A0ABU4RXV1_9GAMM|nr:alanine dehydrogenase [Gilvimarinus sp. SDUM040013]MDO3385093.1 alanine dehydrogenase [Gilvimarinus sp. SDUM040013]MDX6848468.1 alanine dehydrogenase [Gilvimarinus sp. SDUM040013]